MKTAVTILLIALGAIVVAGLTQTAWKAYRTPNATWRDAPIIAPKAEVGKRWMDSPIIEPKEQ